MSSYDSILKWAREAKHLLDNGNVDGAQINLSMIISQAQEEANRSSVSDGDARVRQLKQVLALHRSMALSGEQPSETSESAFRSAMDL